MRTPIALLFVAAFAFGCASSTPIKTSSMIGMRLDVAVEIYQLAHYTHWSMPNLPPGSDSEVTYFMERGNLDLTYDGRSDKITSATYRPSKASAAKRIDDCY